MNILTPIAASAVLVCVAIQGDLSAQRPDSDLRQQIRRIVREEVKRALAEVHKAHRSQDQVAARKKKMAARKAPPKKRPAKKRSVKKRPAKRAPSATAALQRASRALAEARRALAEAQRALMQAQVSSIQHPRIHMPKVHMPTLQLPRVEVRMIEPRAKVRMWDVQSGRLEPIEVELAPKAKKKVKRPKAKKKRKNKKRTGRIV